MIASHHRAASTPLGSWDLKQEEKATECIAERIMPVT